MRSLLNVARKRLAVETKVGLIPSGGGCKELLARWSADVSNPVDVVKSRMQNQKVGKKGEVKYNNMADCFVKILGEEGILTFWSGFVPAFVKLAPYTIISLILAEKLTFLITGKAAL